MSNRFQDYFVYILLPLAQHILMLNNGIVAV